MTKGLKRDTFKAALVKKTAAAAGVSQRMVRYVIDGERTNPQILDFYMRLQDKENELLKEVKKLVPFN